MALPPATAWTALHDTQLTADQVRDILALVHDDVWVVSACIDRVLDDTATQQVLLNLGLSRTDHVVQKCNDIISLAPPSQPALETLTNHFQSVPTDALLCYLRSVLLRRLDRLNTYIEMEGKFPKSSAMEVDEDIDEWEDDPWADGTGTSSSKPTPQITSTEPPPITLSEFLQNDLLWSACELASLEAFDAVRILWQKHSVALWPSRFKVQECIPEHIHPSLCIDLVPTLDPSSQNEVVPTAGSWRDAPDFSELSSTQDAIKTCLSELPEIAEFDKKVVCTHFPNPLSAEELSTWYQNRVDLVISCTGMIDVALAVVQHGASQGIPSLDQLGEELSLISRLVYDAPQGEGMQDDWTLANWFSMDPITVVRAYLSHSSPETVGHDIAQLVMPYLFVLEARAERAGTPNPLLPTQIIHEYILTTSLESAAAIFEASKPTLPPSQRVIKDDEEMVRVALACLYGSNSLNEWPTMSSIFECLPAWEVPKDEDGDEEAADTTVVSLGAFVTPKTNQPQCTAQDLLLFFQPLSFASLSRALDILDVHLESGEILSRWSVPAPLRWFLQSSGDVKEQRAWANRMARRAGGADDRLDGIEDWEWLLKDMRKLTGNSDPTARGAFCLLSIEEISVIFLNGLLSTGNFAIAKTMLYGPRRKIDLSPEVVESACLACSREFYDNASSGNYKSGDMKLAYDCLDVPPTSENIVKEKDFIEATSRICSFNVPSKAGLTLSPIEIRLTKDRLSLVSRVISSNSDAYKHTQVILDLSDKLGFKNDAVAEVKVLAMIADTALQAEDFARAYENSERMVRTGTTLRTERAAGVHNDGVQEASEVCWIACFQLGRQPEYTDLPKKMTLLGYALEFCPPDKIHDVLTAWRKLETEDSHSREEKLRQKRSGDATSAIPRTEVVPRNVASSLRARLQDFQMPSPPLLSTPDAAALATRTFKSVAANFPFGVGHRGLSHSSEVDEVASMRSEGSRRTTDSGDVSSHASRVLSKGIGWLIGADEEL